MNNFIDAVFKDDSPLNTVEKIKTILKRAGIETEEKWHETHVPYCFSLSLKIKDLNFETSGKGLSPEYALASAYGEMIERVQLCFLGKRATQKDGSYSMNDSQDIQIPLSQLTGNEIDIYQKISDNFFARNSQTLPVHDLLKQYADEDDNICVTPFVNLMDGNKVFFPSTLRKALYTSNGCAAGNTIEEAIVQALSEIVERNYRLRIIEDNICVPDIPDDELKKYQTPYKIIEYIREQGYNVWVKDCSLGQKFPVVCVCYVHKNTGRYHTHFGAYPVFEIALTRALTETFQGRNIDSFAQYSDFSYGKKEKDFVYNMSSELTYGTAKRNPEFFVGNTKIPFNTSIGFKGKNNSTLLKECIDFFKDQNCNILVRNASGLGFPTVQVIVPGYSEIYIHRLAKNNDDNQYLSYSINTLRNPANATIEDMMGFLLHITETSALVYHPGRTGFLASAKIMANLPKTHEDFYLAASMAYVYYALGNLVAASKYAGEMIRLGIGSKDDFLICTKRYLDLQSNKYESEQIEKLLRLFHKEETVKAFYDKVNCGKNPFDEFVLHCDQMCHDSCILKQSCCQAKAQKLINLINQKTKELNIEEFCGVIQKIAL